MPAADLRFPARALLDRAAAGVRRRTQEVDRARCGWPTRKDWLFEPRWVQQGLLAEPTEVNEQVARVRRRRSAHRGARRALRATGPYRRHGASPPTPSRVLDEHRYIDCARSRRRGLSRAHRRRSPRTTCAPDRVLHGWLLTRDRSFRPGSSFFHRNQEYGFYSLFHLARALRQGRPGSTPLHWRRADQRRDSASRRKPSPYPDKATVLGPCAVIPREFPNITCALVDLDLGDGNGAKQKRNGSGGSHVDGAVLDRLEAELWAPTGDVAQAWRGDVRWQRHVRACDRSPSTTPRPGEAARRAAST